MTYRPPTDDQPLTDHQYDNINRLAASHKLTPDEMTALLHTTTGLPHAADLTIGQANMVLAVFITKIDIKDWAATLVERAPA